MSMEVIMSSTIFGINVRLYTTANRYNSNYGDGYVEGGLNPIGWENYMDRYWLCMFWSIQSITSIG